jgi:hypothetical protein
MLSGMSVVSYQPGQSHSNLYLCKCRKSEVRVKTLFANTWLHRRMALVTERWADGRWFENTASSDPEHFVPEVTHNRET